MEKKREANKSNNRSNPDNNNKSSNSSSKSNNNMGHVVIADEKKSDQESGRRRGGGREFDEEDEEEEDEKEDEEERDSEKETSSESSEDDVVEEEPASSFKNMLFKSEEVKDAIKNHFAMDTSKRKIRTQTYDSKKLFPEWMLRDPAWTNSNADTTGVHISQIFQTAHSQRTAEQTSTLVKWLMSVWRIAAEMGFRKCSDMTKSFKYFLFSEGDNIIVEGERGLTFYIIISGTVDVIKDNIGKVASLGMGTTFGELALLKGDKEGNDVRNATIQAVTKVETIILHKLDFDRFSKDYLTQEKRENFLACRECKLFETWNRAKIDLLSNHTTRKTYSAGDYIFKQDAPADCMYIILEGTVQVITESLIVNKNKWPVGLNQWSGISKSNVSSIVQVELGAGDYFGEIGVVHNAVRSASVVAKTAVVCVCIGKDELLHLTGPNSIVDVDRFKNHDNLLESVSKRIVGGPSSTLSYGGKTVIPYSKGKNLAAAASSSFKSSGNKKKKDKKPSSEEVPVWKRKSAREQKFSERFYEDVTKKDAVRDKISFISLEAMKLQKTRDEFMAKVHSSKSKIVDISTEQIGIGSVVSKYKKPHSNNASATKQRRPLTFNNNDSSGGGGGSGDGINGFADQQLFRPKTASHQPSPRTETSSLNGSSSNSSGLFPDVNDRASSKSANDTVRKSRNNLIFTTIDRGLNTNRGAQLRQGSFT
jgi:CRP-like cAMP-binding protein